MKRDTLLKNLGDIANCSSDEIGNEIPGELIINTAAAALMLGLVHGYLGDKQKFYFTFKNDYKLRRAVQPIQACCSGHAYNKLVKIHGSQNIADCFTEIQWIACMAHERKLFNKEPCDALYEVLPLLEV